MTTKNLKAVTIEHSPDGFSICFHRRIPYNMERRWYFKVDQLRTMAILRELQWRSAQPKPYVAYKSLAVYYRLP